MSRITDSTLDIRERREALVREHMESENHHDFEVTLGTFGHPRYEIVPTGDVFDGEDAVCQYFEDSRTAFPDQRNELIALHHTDAGVEFDLKGTHQGPLRGIPATGKAFILSQLGLVQPAPSLQDPD